MQTSKVKVYLFDSKRVILEGKCGDNFGYLKDIDKNISFSTYGYNTINFNDHNFIGYIDKVVSYTNFISK